MSRRKNREINVFSTSAIDLFASALGVFIILVMVLFPYFGKRYKIKPQPVKPVAADVTPEELRKQITSLREMTSSLQTDLNDRESIIRQMTSKLKTTEVKASKLESEVTQLKELTQTLQSGNSMEETVDKLQSQLNQVNQEAVESRKKIEEVTQESQQLSARNQQLQAQNQQLQQQLENKSKETATSEKSSNFMAVIIQWPTLKHDVDLEVVSPAGKTYNFKNRKHKSNPAQFTLDSRTGPGSEVWQTSELEVGKYRVKYKFYNNYGNSENATVDAKIFTKKGAFKIPSQTLEFPKKRSFEFSFTVTEEGEVKTQL